MTDLADAARSSGCSWGWRSSCCAPLRGVRREGLAQSNRQDNGPVSSEMGPRFLRLGVGKYFGLFSLYA
jgi:hypothetical protein